MIILNENKTFLLFVKLKSTVLNKNRFYVSHPTNCYLSKTFVATNTAEVQSDGQDGCVSESCNKNNFKHYMVDKIFFNNAFPFFDLIYIIAKAVSSEQTNTGHSPT